MVISKLKTEQCINKTSTATQTILKRKYTQNPGSYKEPNTTTKKTSSIEFLPFFLFAMM